MNFNELLSTKIDYHGNTQASVVEEFVMCSEQGTDVPRSLLSSAFMRVAHVAILFVASWCVMVTTHEVGHLIGGWISGATLKACDLLPWHLPYSIHSPDPYPLVTLWGGPILGVVIPVLVALIFRQHATWFITYFCVLANGIYLAVAWVSADRHLDTPRLLEAGTPPVMLAIYCCVTIGCGYCGFRKGLKRTWNK